jgi:hypothetical protein
LSDYPFAAIAAFYQMCLRFNYRQFPSPYKMTKTFMLTNYKKGNKKKKIFKKEK